MIVHTFVVGPLENNCFIVADEISKECLVVDPADEPDRILEDIKEHRLKAKYIACTHAHFDHVGALSDIKRETGASILIHRDELPIYRDSEVHARMWGFDIDPLPEPDIFVEEGQALDIGSLHFTVLHTPGHSPGGICIFGEGIVITGDTLFAGSVGRTDLPGGDIRQLRRSFARLLSLPGETRVLPGHGPETTIARERIENFFNAEI